MLGEIRSMICSKKIRWEGQLARNSPGTRLFSELVVDLDPRESDASGLTEGVNHAEAIEEEKK